MNLFTRYDLYAQAQLQQVMELILQSSLTPLSVDLGHDRSPRLSYDSRSKSVELRDIVYRDTAMGTGSNIPVDPLYAWLETQKVTRAKAYHIYNYKTECLRAILTSRLKHLELVRMFAWAGQFDRDLWSETIQIISGLPNLQQCRLSKLNYAIVTTWSANYARYFELPGYGRYFCEISGFKLLFPNGTVMTEIDGDEIREKQYDLASYVRAEEDRKRQRIIGDGRVQDDVVGIIHEVQE